MTNYLQGSSATLTVQWYEYLGGPASDVTAQTITITRITDSVVVVGPTAVGITHPATGLYAYVWAIGAAEVTGDYAVVWNATDFQSDPVQASEIVTVIASAVSPWATLADVLARTGKTVTQAQLNEAHAVIEIYVNRTNSASANFSPRDLVWLNRATVFQAAWQIDQPGYHQRNSYEEITQDGLQIVYGKEWQVSLAPVAARALKNLSWKGTRTAITATLRTPLGYKGGEGDFLNEADDVYNRWDTFSMGAPDAGEC